MKLYLQSLFIPTEEAGERYTQAKAECWANTPLAALDNECPWELAQTPAGLARVRQHLTTMGQPAELRRVFEDALKPLPPSNHRLVDAFERSGGLLNLFLRRPVLADDEQWMDGESTARSWNHTPSELFSGLTPAEVVVGGGPEELELLDELVEAVKEGVRVPPEGWPSEGEVSKSFLMWLRGWQIRPLASMRYRAPMTILFEERRALVRRRMP